MRQTIVLLGLSLGLLASACADQSALGPSQLGDHGISAGSTSTKGGSAKGGVGGTAGGIRVGTLAVLLLAIWAEVRGRRDIEAYGKRIGTEVLRLAVSVTLISLFSVLVGTAVFMAVTGIPLDRSLYEVVSAFATCGLTTGITGDLNTAGEVTLIVLMYVGRVGSLTVVAALALNRERRVIRYPAERPLVG